MKVYGPFTKLPEPFGASAALPKCIFSLMPILLAFQNFDPFKIETKCIFGDVLVSQFMAKNSNFHNFQILGLIYGFIGALMSEKYFSLKDISFSFSKLLIF